MLNLMKEMKEAGKSDHPMNLSTMLSNVDHHLKRQSDSSLSPRSPRGHFGGGDDDDDDIDDMEEDDGVDSSVAQHRKRHSSGDIRAQFMADLRRLGRNIPHYGNNGDEPASSTTASPPLSSRLPNPPPLLQLPTSEDSLPPRKRKVSQEHHSRPDRSDRADDPASSSSPFNGNGNGNESESSGLSSPEKQQERRRNDESVSCKN